LYKNYVTSHIDILLVDKIIIMYKNYTIQKNANNEDKNKQGNLNHHETIKHTQVR